MQPRSISPLPSGPGVISGGAVPAFVLFERFPMIQSPREDFRHSVWKSALVKRWRVHRLEIEVNTHGSTKVILLPDKVEGEAVAAVETILRQLMQEGTRNILCNFSRTEIVADAGLAMFVSVLKDFHRLQGQMAFCLLKPGVRELFAAAGLTNVYHYYDQDEALQAQVLRELTSHFSDYVDCHSIRLRHDTDRRYIEIYLEFDGELKMKQVQRSIDTIKNDLETKISNTEVLIIPATANPS
jgi:anti-anti-sigma factor